MYENGIELSKFEARRAQRNRDSLAAWLGTDADRSYNTSTCRRTFFKAK